MNLKAFLEWKKEPIMTRWASLILETYPPDASHFLKMEKDRFTNPVGHTISTGIETVFDEVINGISSDKTTSALDSIIRLRAVQDFAPSQAVSFIFLLKRAVREEVRPVDNREINEELLQFETRIDGLVAMAFDMYVKCREDISLIKIGEARAERAIALRLMKLMGSEKEKASR
jgi:hypothetical protein